MDVRNWHALNYWTWGEGLQEVVLMKLTCIELYQTWEIDHDIVITLWQIHWRERWKSEMLLYHDWLMYNEIFWVKIWLKLHEFSWTFWMVLVVFSRLPLEHKWSLWSFNVQVVGDKIGRLRSGTKWIHTIFLWATSFFI